LLPKYLIQTQTPDVSVFQAARYASFYPQALAFGCLAGAVLLRSVSPSVVLFFCAIGAALAAAIAGLGTGPLGGYALINIGLFNGILFPTIFALAIENLGEDAHLGSGLLLTANGGGGIVAAIIAGSAGHLGISHTFLLPCLCYLAIAGHGLKTAARPA